MRPRRSVSPSVGNAFVEKKKRKSVFSTILSSLNSVASLWEGLTLSRLIGSSLNPRHRTIRSSCNHTNMHEDASLASWALLWVASGFKILARYSCARENRTNHGDMNEMANKWKEQSLRLCSISFQSPSCELRAFHLALIATTRKKKFKWRQCSPSFNSSYPRPSEPRSQR